LMFDDDVDEYSGLKYMMDLERSLCVLRTRLHALGRP
jgi:hypothetical protein